MTEVLAGPARPLLEEAAAWRLTGLLFECPSDAWRARLIELAPEVSDPELKAAVAAAPGEATEGLFHTTFGPGGSAAPREVSHRRVPDPGRFLAELAAYYSAFAYLPTTDEPLDHVSVEAGFVGYLRLKEAFALASGDDAAAAVARDAARQFVKDHIAVIAEPLATSLRASGIAYLGHASAALISRAKAILG